MLKLPKTKMTLPKVKVKPYQTNSKLLPLMPKMPRIKRRRKLF